MATIKACTDIPQSKILADILPLDTADMKWYFWKEEIDAPKCPTFGYSKDAAEFYKSTEAVYLPCWSLSALLSLIPKHIKGHNVLRVDIDENTFALWYDEIGLGVNTKLPNITNESAVDACVNMIEKLHEQNLL